jgi:hypothetical protein
MEVLGRLGLHTDPESTGRHYARILVAARPERLPQVVDALGKIAANRTTIKSDPDELAIEELANPRVGAAEGPSRRKPDHHSSDGRFHQSFS